MELHDANAHLEPTPGNVWSASDYAATARRLRPASELLADALTARLPHGATVVDIGAGHGDTTRALMRRGFTVTAIEPSARMRSVGQHHAPEAHWMEATGEETGLSSGSYDAVASAFGTMFCDPCRGPAEWARITRPGGLLVMTAWADGGFLDEMTRRMTSVFAPGSAEAPPHMTWCRPEVAAERLVAWFDDVEIEEHELDWHLASVDEGMELYRDGSPTHAWALAHAGDHRDALLTALRGHLVENAGDDGAIRASASYGVITAVRR